MTDAPTPDEVAKALEDCCPCIALGEGGCQQHVACSYQKWGAKTIRSLVASLDAVEAEKRAAVAAAYAHVADVVEEYLDEHGDVDLQTIRDLSDTDALAQYAEKVRAEELERCAQIAEDWLPKHLSSDPYNWPDAIAAAIRGDK